MFCTIFKNVSCCAYLIVFSCVISQKSNAQINKKPNILFIVLDDAGIDFGAYGSTFVNTPNFDRVAKEGLLFNKAYTPNAKCGPSRSCIMTGRNPWQLEAAANHWIYFPTVYKTYQEALQDAGYKIGFTGKGFAPGKALDVNGKNRLLLGREYKAHKLIPPTSGLSKDDYAENFKDFLKETKDSIWSFWIGLNEPHRPYEFGTGERIGGKSKSMIKKVPDYWPDTDSVRTDMLDYAFEIEYADRQIGKILQHLSDAKQLDNTLLIITSDHGMPFPRVKGNQYENANHIPFAMMWKNMIKNPGRKVDDHINFTDLAPTFLEAANVKLETSGMHPVAGRSLIPIIRSFKAGQVESNRDFVLVGQERHDFGRPNDQGYPIRGINKGRYCYIKNYEATRWPAGNPETGYLNTDGGATKSFILNQRRNGEDKYFWKLNFGLRPSEELYDMSKDPNCVRNLAYEPAFSIIKKQLKSEMEAKLKEQGDLRMFGFGGIYEKYPFSDINGFYERYMNGEKIKTGWVNPTDYEKGPIEDR